MNLLESLQNLIKGPGFVTSSPVQSSEMVGPLMVEINANHPVYGTQTQKAQLEQTIMTEEFSKDKGLLDVFKDGLQESFETLKTKVWNKFFSDQGGDEGTSTESGLTMQNLFTRENIPILILVIIGIWIFLGARL